MHACLMCVLSHSVCLQLIFVGCWQDIKLAKALGARPASDSGTVDHGLSLILGGHDHQYYISRGVASWEGWDSSQKVLGAEEDDGVLVIKSGADFHDLRLALVSIVTTCMH